MPLLFQEHFDPPGEWGLWRIDESEPSLRRALPLFPEESHQLDTIRGEPRRREYLAARLLLHRMSGRADRGELIKDTSGKPHLQDSQFFVSISHTVGYAAAIAHPRPCGIDVQRIVPRIRKLAGKFVNATEREFLEERYLLRQLHLIWSAKEALYKAYGKRQIDFCRHLFIDISDFDPAGGRAAGKLVKGKIVRHFDLAYRNYEGFTVVGAVEADHSTD